MYSLTPSSMTGSVQERTQEAKAPFVVNCNFLVATTSANPYEICLQAEEQSGPYLNVWIITGIRANLLAELQQLKNENDALESTEVWQWAERRYNEIALKWMSGAAPDSTDLSDLQAIAATCLNQGGRAVLDARALCAMWLQEWYSDEDTCNEPDLLIQPPAALNTNVPAEPTLAPNPVDEVLTVSLPATERPEELRVVEIITIDGRVIYNKVTDGHTARLSIPTDSWEDGVYPLRITSRQSVHARKFVVQH